MNKPPSRQARHRARPDVVYAELRDLIVRGRLTPGSRIVETDVAERLAVSRTPVRGALQRLQQEGYIIAKPRLQQSRPIVAPMTREDANELFSIVAEIEGLAARFAAAIPTKKREALARELTTVNDAFKRIADAKKQNHNRLWELDESFHRKYVEAAAGPRLLALHSAVKPQAERYERLYVSLLSRDLSSSVREHAAIIRAIRAGNPDTAQSAVQSNWRNAAKRLGAMIDSVGERGRW